MSTVLKPERKRADEIKVGDQISKTKQGPYDRVVAVIADVKATWLHVRVTNPAGEIIGVRRWRPNHETKFWVLQ